MRLRVIGAILVIVLGAALSGCMIQNSGKLPLGIPGIGGRSDRTVLTTGHAHVMCQGGQVWIVNMNDDETPQGPAFLPENRRGCSPDGYMHPLGPAHEAAYYKWLAQKK